MKHQNKRSGNYRPYGQTHTKHRKVNGSISHRIEPIINKKNPIVKLGKLSHTKPMYAYRDTSRRIVLHLGHDWQTYGRTVEEVIHVARKCLEREHLLCAEDVKRNRPLKKLQHKQDKIMERFEASAVVLTESYLAQPLDAKTIRTLGLVG